VRDEEAGGEGGLDAAKDDDGRERWGTTTPQAPLDEEEGRVR
jgi:hypothetical protein